MVLIEEMMCRRASGKTPVEVVSGHILSVTYAGDKISSMTCNLFRSTMISCYTVYSVLFGVLWHL